MSVDLTTGFESRAMLDLIARRHSNSRLRDPGPDLIELDQILTAAMSAPDHRRLRPWRFTVFTGESRREFGGLVAQRLAGISPGQDPARLARERDRMLRAPAVVAVGAAIESGSVPAVEQVCAVAAAVQNMLLAATALGYGSIWRTGWVCADDGVKELLGLRPQDYLLGFVYLGTEDVHRPDSPTREREFAGDADHPGDSRVRHWTTTADR
ncbi:MAG: nitroreductase family protein [Nocardioides sp.]